MRQKEYDLIGIEEMRRDYKMKTRLEDSRGQANTGQGKTRQNSGKDNMIWRMVWHDMR